MNILHNRIVAIIICAAIVINSSIAGAGMTLKILRGQVEDVFVTGDENSHGIQPDLDEISTQCYNITTIARRYLPENDPVLTDVLDRHTVLVGTSFPIDKHRALSDLTAATAALSLTLEANSLSEQDQDLLAMCNAEIRSCQSRIAQSGYNSAALKFNRTIASFPAKPFAALAGIEPLEVYQ